MHFSVTKWAVESTLFSLFSYLSLITCFPLIKENVVLKNRKAIIELPDNKESFRLKIVALNEGSVGINTLNFKFKDATNNNEYVSKLKTGEFFFIEFSK